MCVYSAVMDYFKPLFPEVVPPQPHFPWTIAPFAPSATYAPSITIAEIAPDRVAELRSLIERFEKAVEAAKTVDMLTGQPDCEDPEKANLEARVKELERRLDAMAAAGLARGATYDVQQ